MGLVIDLTSFARETFQEWRVTTVFRNIVLYDISPRVMIETIPVLWNVRCRSLGRAGDHQLLARSPSMGVGGGLEGRGEVGLQAQTTSTQRADAHMSRRSRVTKYKYWSDLLASLYENCDNYVTFRGIREIYHSAITDTDILYTRYVRHWPQSTF